VVTVLIIAGGVFLAGRTGEGVEENVALPQGYEYFWGDGCPHCAEVQNFFDSWEGYGEANIEKKEAWNNFINAKLMKARAKYCGIPGNKIGVPFLFTPEGECFIGDEPIIDFFENL